MLFLIVAVASILVLSTVIMTVKSREEIGILLTLGASSKQIILIFFTQGFIVSLIGIIFGVLLVCSY